MVVDLNFEDKFSIITLNRPIALNALNSEVISRLYVCFAQLAGSDAGCLIITGTGEKAFCAGADIKELRGNSPIGHKKLLKCGQRVFDKIADLPMASVAAINGYAFGGGLELALSCTFRIATLNAKVGLPEIRLGLTPGYGGTQRLPRVVGEARALEMIMSGRTVDANEALGIGLVSEVVEGDAVVAAKEFAGAFTGFSLPVLKLVRSAVMRAGDTPLAGGQDIESDVGAQAFAMDDAKEGMTAFEEKREAGFKDV